MPTDIATNTTQNCGKFYEVQLGDYCNLVCLKFNINLNDFLFLNPSVNVNCTNLFAEESYCVVPVGDLTSYPGYPGYVAPSNATTTFAWSDAPKATWVPPDLNITDNTPLANGTRSDCWQFTDGSSLQLLINGSIYSSTCQLIASTYGTSLDQLKNWSGLPFRSAASDYFKRRPSAHFILGILPYLPTKPTALSIRACGIVSWHITQ